MASIEHAIYFEFEYLDEDGDMKTGKTVLYGVTSGRPSESLNQTTEDINNNTVSLSLTIKGVPMVDSTGSSPYKDENGNIVYAWQETSIPSDSGYDDFGKTIEVPKAPTSASSVSI